MTVQLKRMFKLNVSSVSSYQWVCVRIVRMPSFDVFNRYPTGWSALSRSVGEFTTSRCYNCHGTNTRSHDSNLFIAHGTTWGEEGGEGTNCHAHRHTLTHIQTHTHTQTHRNAGRCNFPYGKERCLFLAATDFVQLKQNFSTHLKFYWTEHEDSRCNWALTVFS